jgi:hypothetical protein
VSVVDRQRGRCVVNSIKVQCVVRAYELDGEDTGRCYKDPQPTVIVTAHPIWSERVRLSIDLGDGTVGHQVTVIASDIEKAIKNARNA